MRTGECTVAIVNFITDKNRTNDVGRIYGDKLVWGKIRQGTTPCLSYTDSLPKTESFTPDVQPVWGVDEVTNGSSVSYTARQ